MGLESKEGIFGVLPARKMVREPKRGKTGRGRERKETLADKPLDFENRPLDLSCLSAHMLSSAVRTFEDLSKYVRNNDLTEKRNLDESERLMQSLKLQFQNKIQPV